MPISVTCPSCSHKFSVKDEYAGKRAKCPECEEPLSIPGGAAPTPARPKASPIAKALDDEADESPKAKRRRDEDDEDEKPRAKKRRDDDEDEDDRPKGRRRRRDDDPPKKKSNALVIVLSIVGGVLLLCGGVCGGIWWFVIRPVGETFASIVTAAEQRQAARESFKDNFQQVKVGMTKKQVDELLGPNSAKALEHDVGRVTIHLSDWPQADDRWKPKAKLGHVLMWDKSGDEVVVAFSTDPNAGGTVVGAAGRFGFGSNATEPVKLPAAEKPGDVNNPVATLTADELTSQFAKYRDRWVTVTGAFSTVDTLNQFAVLLAAPPGFTLTVSPPTGGRFPLADPQVQPRESLTFTGKVGGDSIAVRLTEAKFVRRGGGVSPPVNPTGALTVADVLKDHAKHTGKQITVRGKLKQVIEEVSGDRGSVVFEPSSGNLSLHAVFPVGKWRKDFLRGGEDTVELKGTVVGQTGNPGTGLFIELKDCDLLKRIAKDGKEVPLPPVTQSAKPTAVAAESLAAEFAKDMDNAARKYTDKTLTATGTVEKVSSTGLRVTLKGVAADGNKKAYVVDVTFTGAAMRDEAKKLKEGDVVKLTGKYSQFRPSTATAPNTVLLTGGVVEK